MEITGKTGLTALIGSPVEHSISPQMHNEAFRLNGLDYVYLAFNVAPEELPAAMEAMRALNIRGYNVTMPYKNEVAKLVDELTPAAKIAGAVNTVINEYGHLIGHTTDGIGFMESVKDAGYDIIGKKMCLLGSGGAATAIAAQAALDGVREIDILRRPSGPAYEKAVAFSRRVMEHTDCKVSVKDITNEEILRNSIADSDILTNSTNVGMAPHTDACLIPDPSFLRPDLIVGDIIYNPRRTKLYQMAQQAGCRVFNGMYMLLFQGAASFKCWTGTDMPVDAIRSKYFQEP